MIKGTSKQRIAFLALITWLQTPNKWIRQEEVLKCPLKAKDKSCSDGRAVWLPFPTQVCAPVTLIQRRQAQCIHSHTPLSSPGRKNKNKNRAIKPEGSLALANEATTNKWKQSRNVLTTARGARPIPLATTCHWEITPHGRIPPF